jgi:hypothetical protein
MPPVTRRDTHDADGPEPDLRHTMAVAPAVAGLPAVLAGWLTITHAVTLIDADHLTSAGTKRSTNWTAVCTGPAA